MLGLFCWGEGGGRDRQRFDMTILGAVALHGSPVKFYYSTIYNVSVLYFLLKRTYPNSKKYCIEMRMHPCSDLRQD